MENLRATCHNIDIFDLMTVTNGMQILRICLTEQGTILIESIVITTVKTPIRKLLSITILCVVCIMHNSWSRRPLSSPFRPEKSQYRHSALSCEQEKALQHRSMVHARDSTDSSSNVLDLLLARVAKLETRSSGDLDTDRISRLEEAVHALSKTVFLLLTCIITGNYD